MLLILKPLKVLGRKIVNFYQNRNLETDFDEDWKIRRTHYQKQENRKAKKRKRSKYWKKLFSKITSTFRPIVCNPTTYFLILAFQGYRITLKHLELVEEQTKLAMPTIERIQEKSINPLIGWTPRKPTATELAALGIALKFAKKSFCEGRRAAKEAAKAKTANDLASRTLYERDILKEENKELKKKKYQFSQTDLQKKQEEIQFIQKNLKKSNDK